MDSKVESFVDGCFRFFTFVCSLIRSLLCPALVGSRLLVRQASAALAVSRLWSILAGFSLIGCVDDCVSILLQGGSGEAARLDGFRLVVFASGIVWRSALQLEAV